MKYLIVLMSLIVSSACAASGIPKIILPEAKVTVKVVDIDGQPVANADVSMGFDQDLNAFDGKHDSENFRALTNSNGCFSAQAKCYGDIGGRIEKENYYISFFQYDYSGTYHGKSRWEPWNPTIEVTLKEVKNQISMFVKRVNLGVPDFEKSLGFDLEQGDWVAPYGKGVISDFIFYATLDKRGPKDSDYKLTLTFSNEKDGIQTFEGDFLLEGSQLKSGHMAPKNEYLPEWKQFRKRRPKIGETNNINVNRKYYFRVRTKLDEHGNIISAQYGKIYGDFLQFTYYLNPTPNDRNVEFDPDKNLFGGRNRFAP